MKTKLQPFHLVNKSPWPILIASTTMISFYGLFMLMHQKKMFLLIYGIILLSMTSFLWWRDMTREATFQGHYTKKVIKGLKISMILFIISEIMFFFSFFWAFFHSALSPSIDIGNLWPPKNIITFNPMSIPLLNTIILLSSGIMVTWSHHSILNNKLTNGIFSLAITIILGLYFTSLQMFEYLNSPFTMADSIYGSTFFIMTGFHGLHVLIGSTFLLIMFFRMIKMHFTCKHHTGLEMAIWYWHFVDVVWMFLYTWVYWWGS